MHIRQETARAVALPTTSFCHENPWDGGSKNILWISILVAVTLLLAGTVRGQGVLPPTEGIGKTAPKPEKPVVLNKKDMAVANDYVDLLEQLDGVINDYEKYYADLPSSMISDVRAQIAKIRAGIRSGEYAKNADKLLADIQYLQAQLDLARAEAGPPSQVDSIRRQLVESGIQSYLSKAQMASLEAKLAAFEKSQEKLESKLYVLDTNQVALATRMKTLRLSKNLERELESIQILLSQDVLTSLKEASADAADIQVHVLTQLSKNLAGIDQHQLTVRVGDDSIAVINIPTPPEAPQTVAAPAPQVVATPGVVSVPQQIIYDSQSGSAEVVREEIDSLEVTSPSTQIYIDNPTGNIAIKGWDRPMLRVSSKTRMQARTKKEATKYADNIDLNLFPAGDKIYVELVMPELTDPRASVLSNAVSVWVPRANALNCASSFGTVDVAEITGEVTVKARGSEVQLSNLTGSTRALNKGGTISITLSSGDIDLQNSRGAIEVTNCAGVFQIQNEYASIDLQNSRGKASIRNTGEVRVLDHVGDVKIDNSHGNVVVRRLDGDLDAHNAHEQLTIDGVHGSTVAAIQFGTASITDASGPVTASSHFGTLVGKSLAGPITVESHRSDIQLTLRGQTLGPSTISADNSTISLQISPRTNILLSASTNGGQITSNIPVGIAESGTTKSAQFAFGSGSSGFTVTGTDAKINVTESP